MTQRAFITLFKVTVIGLIISALSYLFHPEVSEFTFMMEGHPITGSVIKFGAFGAFLTILMLTAVFMLLVFLEIGFFVLMGGTLIGFIILAVLAPYLWPMLLAVFLVIATLSVTDGRHHNQ